MNFFSRPEPFSRFFVACLLLIFASCQDDQDTAPLQPVAQFTESTLEFSENEGEKTITIGLDKPAASAGVVIVSMSTAAPGSFETIPALDKGQIVIPVEKQQSQVSFRLIPADNSSMDGCKVVKFTILQASDGVVPGSVRDLVVSVNDDEAPAAAYFEVASMRMRESEAEGATISILLNTPAPAEGVLVVKFVSSVAYGTSFTMDPAPVGTKLFLPVAPGADAVTIRILPLNDDVMKADRDLSFRIVDASGGVDVGRDIDFACTITDDDGQLLTNIKSVKSLYVSEPRILHGDYFIEATVTSVDNVSSGRVVIEDYSGAIPLQIIGNPRLAKGELVLVNLKQAILQEQGGILEAGQVATVEKLGEGEIRSRRLTLEQLMTSGNQYQSQTVQVTSLTFKQGDGSTTLLGDRLAGDGTRTLVVRTNPFAAFRDELVPSGIVNITGIIAYVDGKYYLYPQELSDIRAHQFIIRR